METQRERRKGKGYGRGFDRGRGYGKGRVMASTIKGQLMDFVVISASMEILKRVWKKMRDLGTREFARNVEGDQQSEAPTRNSTSTTNTGTTNTTKQGTNPGSSSSSTGTGQGNNRQPCVRQVSTFHLSEPPQEYPEQFELSEDEEELEIERLNTLEESCM